MIYEYWLAGIKEITDLKKQKLKLKNIIIELKMPVLKMFITQLNLVLQRISLLMNFRKNTISI